MSEQARHERTETCEAVGVTLSQAAPLTMGDVLGGRYEVRAEIGSGGSASVWRAVDRATQTEVALKILTVETRDAATWERLGRELAVARQIAHPNLCRVFDLESLDGHRFLTLELADHALRDELRERSGNRSAAADLGDAAAVAAGLAALHEAGIVHGDLSAGNVLRLPNGHLAISDFGLARAEGATALVAGGTLPYRAPELGDADPATRASDVWALGVLLHEMLLGVRPGPQPEGTPIGGSGIHARPRRELRRALPIIRACLTQEASRRPTAREAHARLLALRAPWRLSRRQLFGLGTGAALSAGAIAVLMASGASFGIFSKAGASTSATTPTLIAPWKGEPIDLKKVGKPLATLPGKLHCLDILPGERQARLIWGEPRRAELLDVATGARSPDPILEETFAIGCPQTSPDGKRLAWAARDPHDALQVFVSDNPSGQGGQSLVSGWEPYWIPGRNQLIYKASPVHAGIYSLDLMQQQGILSASRNSDATTLVAMAVSGDGRQAALTFDYSADALESEVQLLRLDANEAPRTVHVAAHPIRAWFDEMSGDLFLQCFFPGAQILIQRLDTQRAQIRGSYSGRGAADQLAMGRETFLSALVAKRGRVDLTQAGRVLDSLVFDGGVASADATARGDVLVQVTEQGRSQLWLSSPGIRPRLATEARFVGSPAFAPNGMSFVFVAWGTEGRAGIHRCRMPAATSCELLIPGANLGWPSFSPDGRMLAYSVGLGGVSRAQVRDMTSGTDQDIGTVRTDCGPHWMGPDLLRLPIAGDGQTGLWRDVQASTGMPRGVVRATHPCHPSAAHDNLRVRNDWTAEVVSLGATLN